MAKHSLAIDARVEVSDPRFRGGPAERPRQNAGRQACAWRTEQGNGESLAGRQSAPRQNAGHLMVTLVTALIEFFFPGVFRILFRRADNIRAAERDRAALVFQVPFQSLNQKGRACGGFRRLMVQD